MISNFIVISVLNYLFVLLSIIVAIYFVQWKHRRGHLSKLASKIPMPEHMSYYPIIGHAHHFFVGLEDCGKNLLKFNSASNYPTSIYVGYKLYCLITRPEDLQIVLNSSNALAKDDLYRVTVPGLGYGLLNLDVKTWRIYRKIIGPTFNQNILNDFVSTFVEQCRIMTKLLENETDKEFDISPFIFACSVDSVFETAIGVKCNFQTDDSIGIGWRIARCMEIAMARALTWPYHIDFIYNFSKMAKEEKDNFLYMHTFLKKILLEKKNQYLKQNRRLEEEPEIELGDTKPQNRFLDQLLKLSIEGNHLTDDEISCEARILIVAGSDTTAMTAAFTLTCLALYPNIQQKVYEEIVDVMGKHRDIEFSDLPKLKYTEMVIKETLRIFPVGPAFLRKVEDDIELGNEEIKETCTLPKGAGIVINLMALHRNPIYYEDPLKFIPERFTPEETAKRHPYSYLPFSGGPRNCIGLRYGMMLAKCIVISILRMYCVNTGYTSIEEIRTEQLIVLKPVLGYKTRLTLRKN